MNGQKMSRIKLCAECIHSRNTGAWPWPRCCYRDATGTTDAAVTRDDAFMAGPDSNCIPGIWAANIDVADGRASLRGRGIGPVDDEAYEADRREAGRAQRIERQRDTVAPLLVEALRGHDLAEAEFRLSALVTMQRMEPETAEHIMSELEAAQTPEPTRDHE